MTLGIDLGVAKAQAETHLCTCAACARMRSNCMSTPTPSVQHATSPCTGDDVLGLKPRYPETFNEGSEL